MIWISTNVQGLWLLQTHLSVREGDLGNWLEGASINADSTPVGR